MPAASAMRTLAELLIASTGAKPSSRDEAIAAFNFVSLRPRLLTLVGTGGFRMLVARTLHLAGSEAHWLAGVTLKADGTFDGLDAIDSQIGVDELWASHVLLLSHLLDLVVRYIGPAMAMAVVRDTWPVADLDNLELRKAL